MHRLLCAFIVIGLICSGTNAVLAAASGQDITLLSGKDDGTPVFQVTRASGDVLTLEVEFPRLQRDEAVLEGETYQLLSLPGGAFYGQDGEASLPSISRLVAIPDFAAVELRVVRTETRTLAGYKLMPLQPDDAKSLVRNETYYTRQGFGDTPLVTVGEPAIMRDQRVIPVTFHPLRYDPARGEVEVAYRQTIELTFGGTDDRNPRPQRRGIVTESFDNLYRHSILNYEGDKSAVGPGSFLYICPDNATILSELEPLLDWRRRQGYNVVVATTTETGSLPADIQNYLQTAYDTYTIPLEFVCLVGDATGSYQIPTNSEPLSGLTGEGDHYYTLLDGADIVPDIHIGRLSIRSTTDLHNIVAKIVSYENDPLMGSDPNWFSRAALVGDPAASGMSCVHVNQLVKHHLINYGYSEIDTVWNGNDSVMLTNYNKGGTIATYRGFYDMSGIQPGDIDGLSNDGKFPFAVVITCDTGSFKADTHCRSEAFLRDGNGGAIACVGIATIGTHTRENNCFFLGILDGVLNSGDWRVGPALSNGKIEMYNNYITNHPNTAEIWCVWNNLMGDPGTEIWTARPEYLTVSHPANLAVGASGVTVTVEDAGSLPLPDSKVALYKDGEILVTGYTDGLGAVRFALPLHSAGTLLVTVMHHNFIPYQGSVNLGSVGTHVTFASQVVDDDKSGQSSGNGDGLVNPGETIELALQVTNIGSATAFGVTGTLICADPYVSIIQGEVSFGAISAGGSVWGATDNVFSLASSTPAGRVVELILETTDGGETWTNLLELTVAGAACAAEDAYYTTPGGDLDPGESGLAFMVVRNVGTVDISGADAILSSLSPWIEVTDAVGVFGPIAVGATAQTSDTFSISVSERCFLGHLATFEMVMDFHDGTSDTVIFQSNVGFTSSTDPVGPDNHGYYAIDNTDTAYDTAPVYSWVEIDPTYGGDGASVGLTDFGTGQDDTRTVDLPFDFTFYGQSYDKISVCSNGWLAMGVTYVRLWYNKTLPCAGGPEAMIAPFWDDLYLGSGGGVFSWYDLANHRFIIEWSRCRLETNNAVNTFQVILFDPAYYNTGTTDGMITCQYNTVFNTDSADGFCTVGIQNQDKSDGLQYTYWNRYATGAAILVAGRAISFQAYAYQPLGSLEGDVTNLTGGGTPVDGASIRVVEASRALFSDLSGHYLGNVPVGTFTVVATHESFAPDTTYNVSIVEDQTTLADFELVDILGPYILNTTEYPHTDDTVGPYVINTNITDYSAVAEQHFYYTSSTSGGPFELTMTLIDSPTGLYQAEIPGQATGSIVQYWLTSRDGAGNDSVAPAGAPFNTFTFYVGGVVTFLDDDMESHQGWTVGDVGDDATSGHWLRADPVGTWEDFVEVQPEDDATPAPGTQCYITGNAAPGAVQGTADVDGGKTTLLSPWFDLAGYSAVTVQYKRWYTNDTGFLPGEDFWVVQVTDDDVTWVNLENNSTSLRIWTNYSFQVEDHVDLTSTVRFRFIASDEGGGSIVEAGVDDFLLTGYAINDVDTEAPTVTVTSPDGGENIAGGAGHFHTVEWNASDNFGVVLTHIILSIDGGITWPDTLATGTFAGSWEWDVPSILETGCRLKIVCLDAAQNPGEDISNGDFTINNLTGVPETIVTRLALTQNQPNPFNPCTAIEFALPVGQQLQLRIYDVEGRLVKTLAQGFHPAGQHVVVWDGTDGRGARTSSGVYFYRLTTPEKTLVRKMMLLK
ncbi:MAG: C25 family cysteine peptidase [bacterium]